MKPSLNIIIVNWNSGNQLRNCLDSITRTNTKNLELKQVLVVDNASSDTSLDNLESLELPLTVIRNKENLGFAKACNQGARSSKADYLLFLNPDTLLFEDSLSKPINFMQQPENQKIGICGIQTIDENENIHRHCTRFFTPQTMLSKMLGLYRIFPDIFPSHFMTEWNHENNQIVDQVIGAFYLVRSNVFDSLNGFDERFFVYGEDMDFAYRAYKMGWLSYYLADANLFHKGNGTSDQVKILRLFYSLRSRIKYVQKHFDLFSATLVIVAILFVEPLSRITVAIFKFSPNKILETIGAYFYLWLNIINLPKLQRAVRS